jgi:hypothetical protein
MCGIAGLVGEFVPGLMARMSAVQAHRSSDVVTMTEEMSSTIESHIAVDNHPQTTKPSDCILL